jgi:hypothetical protein
MLVNPKNLTLGERLETSRRRAGISQREAAALIGLPFKRYIRAEHDEIDDAPAPPIELLSLGEECHITRRRAGFTLQDAERLSGFKAKWIHRAELDQTLSSQALVNFWTDLLEERRR